MGKPIAKIMARPTRALALTPRVAMASGTSRRHSARRLSRLDGLRHPERRGLNERLPRQLQQAACRCPSAAASADECRFVSHVVRDAETCGARERVVALGVQRPWPKNVARV